MWNCLSIPWPEVCPWCSPMRAAVCLCLFCNSALSKLQSFISSVKSCLVRNHIEPLKHLRFDNWLRSVRAFGFENLWKTVLLLLVALRWKPSRTRALCGNTGIRTPPLPIWDSQPQKNPTSQTWSAAAFACKVCLLELCRMLSACKINRTCNPAR